MFIDVHAHTYALMCVHVRMLTQQTYIILHVCTYVVCSPGVSVDLVQHHSRTASPDSSKTNTSFLSLYMLCALMYVTSL